MTDGSIKALVFDVFGTVMNVTTSNPFAAASGDGATKRSGMLGNHTARPVFDARDSQKCAPDMIGTQLEPTTNCVPPNDSPYVTRRVSK